MHASMLGEIEYGLEDTIQPIQGHSAIQSRPVIAYSQLAQAMRSHERKCVPVYPRNAYSACP